MKGLKKSVQVRRDQALAHDGLQDLCQHTLVIVEGVLLQVIVTGMSADMPAGIRPLPIMGSRISASTPLS
jgi:hypothetical protein